MSTTTILHEFERRLDERVARGEIAPGTRDAYLNDASRVFETLLRNIPVSVIQGYMKAEGYRGDYRHIVETLRMLARQPRHSAFPPVRFRSTRRKGKPTRQHPLPELSPPAEPDRPDKPEAPDTPSDG